MNRLDDLKNGRYPGGKNAGGTWQWIAAKFPTHSLYVEPFAGSFAVGRRKAPALRSIAIDADPGVVSWLETIPGVEAIHGCGIEWLETVGRDLAADAVVYCDPPYPLETRTKRRLYDHEWTDDQHARFLAAVTSLRCACLVSTYPNELYRSRLEVPTSGPASAVAYAVTDQADVAHADGGWTRWETQVVTRGGTMRTEVLYANFSLEKSRFVWGEDLPAPSVTRPGHGWRERQRIDRLVRRWTSNWAKRPAAERSAILAGLLKTNTLDRPTLAATGRARDASNSVATRPTPPLCSHNPACDGTCAHKPICDPPAGHERPRDPSIARLEETTPPAASRDPDGASVARATPRPASGSVAPASFPSFPSVPTLVLSLFPGVGLLDRAFEEEGFTVVRGPDLLWGGDVRAFHVPAGVFAGVIGGPPCQDFSTLRRHEPSGHGVAMLAEYCRVVAEAAPAWFLLENVAGVPDVAVPDYSVQRIDVDLCWFERDRTRLRHVQFGSRSGVTLQIPRVAGARYRARHGAALANDPRTVAELAELQGLPADFDLPGFTVEAKKRAIGNGVPLPMGRALARAVREAVDRDRTSGHGDPSMRHAPTCQCGCGRELSGAKRYYDFSCRKRAQRKRDRARDRAASHESPSSPCPP